MRKRRVKYHNVKCEYNGLKFDSKTEMEYYKYLLGLQEKGIVKEIKTQIKYSLSGHTIWIGTQAEYDAISSKNSTTIYFIKG